jgi:amidase
MSFDELCDRPATELARLLRAREVSAVELTRAHLDRIERVDPHVNAVVTLVADAALADATHADARLARGDAVGPLHGLPIAHKDLTPTKGIRTTLGSPIFAHQVPAADSLIVERLKAAGGITLGKTNVPEFGAGSHTFNPVFGPTRNPYDLSRSCGGSSGGAAVALACGLAALADGSDLGGSLRNPASFCNVVGLRPSPGRVPTWPSDAAWYPLAVEGPMGRTVGDVALMLSAMAGPDDRSPIAIEEPGSRFAAALERDFHGVRVAWCLPHVPYPVEPAVRDATATARPVLESLGCTVEDSAPDLAAADRVFKVLRAWRMELSFGHLLDTRRSELKSTVVWNMEEGRKLRGVDVAAAERDRTALYQRVREYMKRHEFLAMPVAQVAPFDIAIEYPTSIDGHEMATYIDWMQSCYFISTLGLPAISVPCGFTPEGLPVGVQLVGRHHDDFGLLQLAHAFERAQPMWHRKPRLP